MPLLLLYLLLPVFDQNDAQNITQFLEKISYMNVSLTSEDIIQHI